MEGSTIAERYRIDHLIGEGGVARVYRGTDLTLDRRVAIKILRPELSEDEDVVARFRREAHSAAKLNHSNIVQIYDTGVDDDRYYIIMEYLPELNLKEIIKRYAPLPLDRVIDVGAACCEALSYAHRQGIVHRDVKPANVLFTDEGSAKLSDFGIAAAAGEAGLTRDGKVLGSAHYISPEQAQGAAAGPLSDIYSLGVTLYEALTGRLPFDGETAADIAALHLRETPPAPRSINPEIPPAAEYLVTKAMARDPQRRYRSADEMLSDIQKLERGMDLDRTGVLQPTPEATMPLPRSAEPSSEREEPLRSGAIYQPDYDEPVSEPARPEPREEDGSPMSAALAGVGVGLLALLMIVAVVFLVRAVFYPHDTPGMREVPNVRGLTEQEAREQIEGRGLVMGDITYEYSEAHPVGRVMEQDPAPGQMRQAGTAVNLSVTRGRETVTVVDVTGTRVDRAQSLLEAAGLTLGRVTEYFHDEEPAGIVFDQEPRPGTQMERGAAIDLSISRGPEEEPEPEEEPGEEDPEEPEPEPDPPVEEEEEPPAPAAPWVDVEEDPDYRPGDAALRRFHVNVTAKGTRDEQRAEVRWRDESGAELRQELRPMQPGETRNVAIRAQGTVTIEVYHENQMVFQQTIPVPQED